MNIFVLHRSPKKAARMLCDRHAVKMILESVQMLCTAFVMIAPEDAVLSLSKKIKLYKPCHRNHPCTIWARERKVNFIWLCMLASHIGKEYTYRYNKVHKSSKMVKPLYDAVMKLKKNESDFILDNSLNDYKLVNFALAMPENIRKNEVRAVPKEAVRMYREYYMTKLQNDWAVYKKGRTNPWKIILEK